MDLFSGLTLPPTNILPNDGVAVYYGVVFTVSEADSIFETLKDSIDWRCDEAIIFGKRIITKRKVAWYGDRAFEYTYSKTKKVALPWALSLQRLRNTIQEMTGEQYNSCLLNLYHTGSEGMAWHSDEERDLKKGGAIASVSFGVTRKFSFKHKKTKESHSVMLEHGSLLVMKGSTQTYWQHCLPPTKKTSLPRINLTFRTIDP